MLNIDVSDRITTFTFARHETFHIRDGWLFKGLNALGSDEDFFDLENAHHKLGVGINMLRSIIYWLQATDLAYGNTKASIQRKGLRLTNLANQIMQKDPYFEDLITLWLLHISLASNRSLATFWYWAFNEFSQQEFTEERLVSEIKEFLIQKQSKPIAESSIVKDARCFIHTYLTENDDQNRISILDTLGSPLSLLGLIRKSSVKNRYKFQIGAHENLPPSVFNYCLYRFKETLHPNDVAVSLEDVRWSPMSPGKLLCLDMHSILQYLEELESMTNYVKLIRTAELNMIMFDNETKSEGLLSECYVGVK